MNKWIQNAIVEKGAPTIRASVRVYHRGGETFDTIIPSCHWIRVKNGYWMPKTLIEQIGAAFKDADVTLLNGSVLFTNERFGYNFKTYQLGRLTTTKEGKKSAK